jgi:hypothetical protein
LIKGNAQLVGSTDNDYVGHRVEVRALVENHVAERVRDLEPPKKPFEWIALFLRCLFIGALVSVAAWMMASFLLEVLVRAR